MKVIVNDKDFKRSAINESTYYGDGLAMTRIGGKYDFVMMMGDGTTYGAKLEEIFWRPIGNIGKPIEFQWEPVKSKGVDSNWQPIEDEYEYDDGEEDWVPFEDMDIYDDEVEYNDDGFDYREWM